MKTIPFRNALGFFRNNQPGFQEVRLLLNLFPDPVILFDFHNQTIVCVNTKTIQFSAFTHSELENSPLSRLLPDYSPLRQISSDADTASFVINLRNGLTDQVVVQLQPLDPEHHWGVLFLEPLAKFQQRQVSNHRQKNHMRVLQELAQALQLSKPEAVNSSFLEAGQILTGAGTLALYRVDPGQPILAKVQQEGKPLELPETILASELGKSGKPQLWKKGRRIKSGLQKIARANDLSYLAYTGIGDEQAIFGLIIAADQKGIPDDNILITLEVLASLLFSVFQHDFLISLLQTQKEQQTQRLTFYKTVNENILDGIILLTTNFQILSINTAAELMLGYADHEIRGVSIDNVIIGADGLNQALDLALEGISTPSLGNTSIHRRDGRIFPAHIQIDPIKHNNDQMQIVVLLRDLSEHHQIITRTQQLEQRALLGEVTAIFAHEVRNPVNNISMALQLMDMNLDPDDPTRDMVNRMKQDTDRLTHLMDSVLLFSRSTDYKLEPLDLHLFLERLLQRWQPRLTRIQVKSEFKITTDRQWVLGNEKSLEQVFTNLFNNALRAMSEAGGILGIRISQTVNNGTAKMVQIDVSDTGIGIPSENIDSIFNPFFTTDPQGTGLGLSITQRIITAHKGTIQVESFPGGGTVFHILLPALNNQQI
jgi:two-component system, NtrC family, sensor histidine kinase AtoS